MLNAIQGVKLHAHCYTWSEALSSILHMERSFMTRYAHCFTWSEALGSMLYKE